MSGIPCIFINQRSQFTTAARELKIPGRYFRSIFRLLSLHRISAVSENQQTQKLEFQNLSCFKIRSIYSMWPFVADMGCGLLVDSSAKGHPVPQESCACTGQTDGQHSSRGWPGIIIGLRDKYIG